VWFVDIIG
jgi:hypothetical protein